MVKQQLHAISGEAGIKRSSGEQPAQLPGGPQRDSLDTGVCLVTSDNPHKRANGVFLACAYAVAAHGMSPHAAFAPFWGCSPPLLSFRDASFGLCSYALTILDCLNGVYAAIQRGFFDLERFDLDAYVRDEQLHCGDINWIVPGLFCAFSGPLDSPKPLGDGKRTWAPTDYVQYFKQPQHDVTLVVRLNKACYDKRHFTKAGVRHAELFYPDGGLAPPAILASFIDSVERNTGAVGVHCKAGLGRTGTCIGAYLMKHFRMTAREAIAWMRICRPGSVLGPQQQYLETLQGDMWQAGMDAGLHEKWMAVLPPPVDLAAALGINLAKAARRLGLRRVPGERPPPGSSGGGGIGGGPAPHRPSIPLRPAAAAWCAYAPWSLAALDVGCCVPGGVQSALHGTVPVAWCAVSQGQGSRSERGIRRSRAPGGSDTPEPDPPAPPLGALDWQLAGKCGAWSVTPAAAPVLLSAAPTGQRSKHVNQPGTPTHTEPGAITPGFSVGGSSSSGGGGMSPGRRGRSPSAVQSDSGAFAAMSALRLTHMGTEEEGSAALPESPLTAVSGLDEAPDALDALEGSVDAEIRASLGGAGGFRTPHKNRAASDSDALGAMGGGLSAAGSRSRLASAGGGSLIRPLMGAPTPSADVSEKVLPPGSGGDAGRQTPPQAMGSTGFTPQQLGGRSTPGSRAGLTSSPLGVGTPSGRPAHMQRSTSVQAGSTAFASPSPSRMRPSSGTPTEEAPFRLGSRGTGRTSPLTGAYSLSAAARRR